MIEPLLPQFSREHREVSGEPLRRGLFDRLADGHFRMLDDGRKAFYPAGACGRRGYIVASTDQEVILRQRLHEGRKAHRIAYYVFLFAWIAVRGREMIDFTEWRFWELVLLFAGGGLLDWSWSHVAHYRITRRMERASVPNTPIVHWRTAGRNAHPAFLAFQVLFIVGFTGIGLYLSIRDMNAFGILVFLLFGGMLIPFCITVRNWWKSRKED